jgi:transposase
MKTSKLRKVCSGSSNRKWGIILVPELLLKGVWLQKQGFEIGDQVEIAPLTNQLIINRLPPASTDLQTMIPNTAKSLREEYNVADGIIRRWKREYEAKSGDFSKKRVVSAQELELKTLKKELRDVKMERELLKKAVSIFSKSDQ